MDGVVLLSPSALAMMDGVDHIEIFSLCALNNMTNKPPSWLVSHDGRRGTLPPSALAMMDSVDDIGNFSSCALINMTNKLPS